MEQAIRELIKQFDRLGQVIEVQKSHVLKDKLVTTTNLVRAAVAFNIMDSCQRYSDSQAEIFLKEERTRVANLMLAKTKAALKKNLAEGKIGRTKYNEFDNSMVHLKDGPNDIYDWVHEVCFELNILTDAKINTYQQIIDENNIIIGQKLETDISAVTADKATYKEKQEEEGKEHEDSSQGEEPGTI